MDSSTVLVEVALADSDTTSSVVEPQSRPVTDSTTGWGTGLPLSIGALLFVGVFASVVWRSQRARRRSEGRGSTTER